ncbi:response regulator [Candidatus Poribacteria bacterium]|nr:MAG: response regulator [Candidatus Poribacteria bacterium]
MKAKVLIVDDNVSFLHSMEFLLSGEYEVYLASDGWEALRIAGEREIDVALIDVRMPGMNGIETLKRLKALSPRTEVIVITAHGEAEAVKAALAMGASGFLEKGFSLQELKESIREALKRKGIDVAETRDR